MGRLNVRGREVSVEVYAVTGAHNVSGKFIGYLAVR